MSHCPFGIQSDNIRAVQAAGVEFNDGVSKEDFRIVIESLSDCIIESFTANEIDCRPPIRAPPFNERFRYNNVSTLGCHLDNNFHVQVSKIFPPLGRTLGRRLITAHLCSKIGLFSRDVTQISQHCPTERTIDDFGFVVYTIG